jgi:hypothetical protein
LQQEAEHLIQDLKRDNRDRLAAGLSGESHGHRDNLESEQEADHDQAHQGARAEVRGEDLPRAAKQFLELDPRGLQRASSGRCAAEDRFVQRRRCIRVRSFERSLRRCGVPRPITERVVRRHGRRQRFAKRHRRGDGAGGRLRPGGDVGNRTALRTLGLLAHTLVGRPQQSGAIRTTEFDGHAKRLSWSNNNRNGDGQFWRWSRRMRPLWARGKKNARCRCQISPPPFAT